MADTNAKVDRLEKMLNLALHSLRNDDEEAALLALMEATHTAEQLPKKAALPDIICLPDLS